METAKRSAFFQKAMAEMVFETEAAEINDLLAVDTAAIDRELEALLSEEQDSAQ